jgi:TalC/MipB family fructose-6-phosphate aldolase
MSPAGQNREAVMQYILDTVSLLDVKRCNEFLPISGVTSNPSIIKQCGMTDFYGHFQAIRDTIGLEKTLHVQVIGQDYDAIMKDAHAILDRIGHDVYIKIPVTMHGLKAIKALKKESVRITATAVYQTAQALLALEAGADYVAPYYNRMMNMEIDADRVIGDTAAMIAKYGYQTQILAASFKNMAQVNRAFEMGAQAATLQPQLLYDIFEMPAIQKAVDAFSEDWKKAFGSKTPADL